MIISFNNKIIAPAEGKWLERPIPANTIRLRYKVGITPVFNRGTGICIDSNMNVWDLTCNDPDWNYLLIRGVSSVQHLSQTYLEEVLGANTSNVTNMRNLFFSADNLKKVKKFDTSNVTNIDSMFAGCSSLKEIPFFDFSNVTAMPMAFKLTAITTIPQFDTSKVTDMNYTFQYCWNLRTIPLLNTSNVVWMQNTFDSSGIETLPALDTSKVTTMSGIMSECRNLKQVPLLNTSSLQNATGMFYQCLNVESGALAMYNQMANQANPPTSHSGTFFHCGTWTTTGAAELAQIPDDWK